MYTFYFLYSSCGCSSKGLPAIWGLTVSEATPGSSHLESARTSTWWQQAILHKVKYDLSSFCPSQKGGGPYIIYSLTQPNLWLKLLKTRFVANMSNQILVVRQCRIRFSLHFLFLRAHELNFGFYPKTMPFLGTVSCGAQDEFLLGRLMFLLIPAGLGTVSYGAQAKNFL